MSQPYNSKLQSGELGTTNNGIPETIDRGLYEREIESIRNAPYDLLPATPSEADIRTADRNYVLIGLLWETWARISELMAVNIQDIDMENRTILILHPKRKVKKRGGPSISEERTTDFSRELKREIIKYLGPRQSGPLLLSKYGKRLSDRSARTIIHRYAIGSGIQKIVGYTAKKEPRYLIIPKALREAGEYYAIMAGMDRDLAARRAGHSREVQDRNYVKYDPIRARNEADKVRSGSR